jgi:hypothetical protein
LIAAHGDDTAAVQQMIDTGAPVPPREYFISQPVVVRNGAVLHGSVFRALRRGQTVLKVDKTSYVTHCVLIGRGGFGAELI